MATSKDDDKELEEDVSDVNKAKWARTRQRFTRSSTLTHEITEKPISKGREPIRVDSVLNGYVVSRVSLSRSCGYEKGDLVRDRTKLQFACGTLSEVQSFWRKTQSNGSFTSEVFSKKRGMVLTFTGSIGNIYDHHAIQEVSDVLEKVIRATNAILVTSGQKSPMNEAMGRLVRNLNRKRTMKEKYIAVGMVPWSNVYTDMDEYADSDLFDVNHSRLLMIRPGINSKEHDAIEFVEKVITTDPNDGSYVLPRVIVAFGGGMDTLRKVYAAVDNNTVVHFIKNSGGVTDLLIGKKNEKTATKGLERQDTAISFAKTPVMPARNTDRLIAEILGKENVEEARKILDELTPEKLQYCRECSLDMLCNFIFLECIRNPRKDYKVLCHNVLERGQDLFSDIMDKQQMADLLFENLTWEDIAILYRTIPPDAQLRHIVQTTSVPAPSQRQVFDDINKLLLETLNVTTYSLPAETRLGKRPTHKDFFVWYLLTEQLDTARMLWMKSSQMSTQDSILASSILDGMTRFVYGESLIATLKNESSAYTNHVINVLNESYEDPDEPKKKEITEALLLNRHFNYFNIYYERGQTEVFQQCCMIDIIRKRWYGELEQKFEGTPQKIQSCIGGFHTNEVRYVLMLGLAILLAMPFFAFALPFFMLLKKDAIDSFLLKYNSAALKFCMHAIAHVVFLIVFAYMLLLDLPGNWTGTDLVMIGWVFCIFLEELRKFVVVRGTFLQKVKTYFDWKNTCDIVGVLLFTVGVVLRLGAQKQDAARVCFAVVFVLFVIRILALCYASRLMGPKLVVIGRMLREDLIPLFGLLFVILMAFTIADFAVLYPNSDFDWYFLEDFMRNGYWLLFHEIGLDELKLKEPQCSNDATVYMAGTLPRCPSTVGQSAAPYFRGVFILLAVLLLLNILIAMFSETYKKIQDESYMHWLFAFNNMSNDYRAKAFLPPPYAILFLFVGAIYLISWLVALPIRICRARKSKVTDKKKKRTKDEEAVKNHVNNHSNVKSANGDTESKDDEAMDEKEDSSESQTLNFYEGMEVFMKIFVAMTFKEKIDRDIVRTFEKAMKLKYVKKITPNAHTEENDMLRDQVDRTEILERMLTQQDQAVKRLEKRTARIEEDLDDMDKWMDGVDKTLAIYRGTSSSASRRSRARSHTGSRTGSKTGSRPNTATQTEGGKTVSANLSRENTSLY